jgi:hypothetical protein
MELVYFVVQNIYIFLTRTEAAQSSLIKLCFSSWSLFILSLPSTEDSVALLTEEQERTERRGHYGCPVFPFSPLSLHFQCKWLANQWTNMTGKGWISFFGDWCVCFLCWKQVLGWPESVASWGACICFMLTRTCHTQPLIPPASQVLEILCLGGIGNTHWECPTAGGHAHAPVRHQALLKNTSSKIKLLVRISRQWHLSSNMDPMWLCKPHIPAARCSWVVYLLMPCC